LLFDNLTKPYCDFGFISNNFATLNAKTKKQQKNLLKNPG